MKMTQREKSKRLKRGGRPTKREVINYKISLGVSKMTPEVIQKLEQTASLDATIAEMCFYAGISESTYYEWMKQNPELSERIKQLREEPTLKARQTIINNLNDANMAFKYLEKKRKMEFGGKDEIGPSDERHLHIHLYKNEKIAQIVKDAEEKVKEAIREEIQSETEAKN